MSSLICRNGLRREQVRTKNTLTGIDYLEVGRIDHLLPDLENQRYLRVYFLGKAPLELDKTNILIEGGRRIRDIQVVSVTVKASGRIEFDDVMEVEVDKAGDFSSYTLRVVGRNLDPQGQYQNYPGFDPRYDRIVFNFKVDCPNDFDCKTEPICPVEKGLQPDINYLAKDYASFRQTILDRLALLMPEWRERHIPDIGITLVEVLAYVGDHLSYYQDAVASEAYLDTARQRISVRRHAQLVDYQLHEGCNARTWLAVEVETDLPAINTQDIYFITKLNDALLAQGALITEQDLKEFQTLPYQVFEPMDKLPIQLYKDHNRIGFYTWEDQECCIAKGSTSATLVGEWLAPDVPGQGHECNPKTDIEAPDTKDTVSTAVSASVKLRLQVGDILVFEEVIGPETGQQQDANPKHRHAVRLTGISADIDPLNGQAITHITWAGQDALPFPLCLSVLGPPPGCATIKDVSVAWGNVILIDHGQTINESLDGVLTGEITECCQGVGMLAETNRQSKPYNPILKYSPLSYSEAHFTDTPAALLLSQNVRKALPLIRLSSIDENARQAVWSPKPDLLASQANDLHFVAEADDDNRVHLRFGNGDLGKKPAAGMKFDACYRIGNGAAGNVGAGSIVHVLFKNKPLAGFKRIRNPLAAQGGTDWEPVSEAKLSAPQAFRKDLQRAVIADDYAAIVRREFTSTVQNAVARLRWNGSWYEVWVAVDVFGREEADQALLDDISCRLHRYRRIGHDLVVKSAVRVPLDIELRVCVKAGYLRGQVKAELLQVFSNKALADGKLGFFHPDKLSFGDDIYLSKIVASAQAVVGVESVEVIKMQRFGGLANAEIEQGLLPLSPLEIARLDNDPSFPENGKLALDMRGGR